MSESSGRGPDEDVVAIRALIARQFASVNWSPKQPADWTAFTADFLPDATLFPAARPARVQSVGEFVERMERLANTTLKTFGEAMLGARIEVFGNVAIAFGICEFTENDDVPHRGVEALLLVKDNGNWRIAAQAWDLEGPEKPIPDRFLDNGSC